MSKRIYYHYCSVETFFNITQTATLRLGNPLSMNDYAEIIWFLDLIEKYAYKKNYSKIIQNWKLIEKIMKDIIQKIDFPYIICLSKEEDVLSQWRSYADDGKGVAIGINVDELLGKNDLLDGKDIIYDFEQQMKLLDKQEINKCLDEIEKISDEQELYRKVKILVSHLLENSMICKNPAFQEEKEYRIYCLPQKSKLEMISDIKFRMSSGQILPYREIDFSKYRYSLIQNIVLGPKSQINDRNLWLFLKGQGFKWTEQENEWSQQDGKWLKHVKISNATYR